MMTMMKYAAVGAVLCLAAGAADAGLLNADIENNTSELFGPIDFWGPNGGWADHASFSKPGNETLGLAFGFYSVNNDESVGQVTDMVYQDGVEYTFGSYGQGGGNDVGNAWELLDGVSYTPSAGDGAAGNAVWVRLGPGDAGSDPEDVWFDSFFLVPAPSPTALLGIALLAGARRRR